MNRVHDDTIAAISTAMGEGGVGIVRISGKNAIPIAGRLFVSSRGKSVETLDTFTLTHGHLLDRSGGEPVKVDEVLLAVMRSPRSYTREDVVEIHCHGGLYMVRKALELALAAGARYAQPGEFTLRAFLNGRLDLSQAEAVMDLVRAKTGQSGCLALAQMEGSLSRRTEAAAEEIATLCAHVEASIDFPEEDIEPATVKEIEERLSVLYRELTALSDTYEEGRFFRDGMSVAIVGRPNVGKSSLLNALLARDRAIVTPVEGTTRDVLEEYLDMGGIPVRIMDTAGIRDSSDLAEMEGVRRSLKAMEGADLVLALFDGTVALREEDRKVIERTALQDTFYLLNKCDGGRTVNREDLGIPSDAVSISLSARTGEGLDRLKELIVARVARPSLEAKEGCVVTNARHHHALRQAAGALARALHCIGSHTPLEITAIELRSALDFIGEITGAVATEDILDRVFRDFCIGK